MNENTREVFESTADATAISKPEEIHPFESTAISKPEQIHPFESTADATAVSKPEEIHHYLWDRIATLELQPGTKLSEVKLAQMFRCSRIPVREAVRRLNAEGALDSQPQRGSFVSRIDMNRVRQVRYLREVLETRVVMDAYDAGLLQPLLPLLRNMLQEQQDMIRFNELIKLTDADTRFHDLFYQLQNKEFVQQHTGRHDIHYIRARRFALGIERSDDERMDDSVNIVSQHVRMVHAIEHHFHFHTRDFRE